MYSYGGVFQQLQCKLKLAEFGAVAEASIVQSENILKTSSSTSVRFGKRNLIFTFLAGK